LVGLVGARTTICDFSYTEITSAFSGGLKYSPIHHVCLLGLEIRVGSVEPLLLSVRPEVKVLQYEVKQTRVFVTSYGLDEATFGPTAMATVHGLFNSLVGQGWTVVAATGNNGAFENTESSSPTVACPASDPDVFAIGGTTLTLNTNGSFNSESAWSNGGGRCSSSWAAPAWETTNSCTGRALSDLALNTGKTAGDLVGRGQSEQQ
jgi:hypothetical protein